MLEHPKASWTNPVLPKGAGGVEKKPRYRDTREDEPPDFLLAKKLCVRNGQSAGRPYGHYFSQPTERLQRLHGNRRIMSLCEKMNTLKVQSSPFQILRKQGYSHDNHSCYDLTGSPQITYFKVVFKRHTNFAIESIAQTFSGTVRYGSKVTSVISRNGDLLGDMWLEAVMKRASSGTTFYPAEQLVKSITVELGGQQLDKLTNTWYRVYDNLYRNNNTDRAAYRAMTDFVDDEAATTTKRFFVPVLFWFCRSPGNYLPLIALQYHELRVTFEFDTAIPGVDSSTNDALDATLFCDYVYLDQQERKKFASQPHEYLIEQIQFTGDENVTVGESSKAQQIRLSFNHPTKLLAWVVAHPTVHGKFTAGYAGATQEANAPLQNAKLMLNGHDRADVRVGAVYNKIVPYQANKANPDAGIYFMSFALSPTQHAPSGSLNLSRIDSAVLALGFKAASVTANTTAPANIANITTPETVTTTDAQSLSALRVFAVNYNVLRVMSGMGGLAYSN